MISSPEFHQPSLIDVDAFWQTTVLPRVHELADPYLGQYAAVLDGPQAPIMVLIALALVGFWVVDLFARAHSEPDKATREPPTLPIMGKPPLLLRPFQGHAKPTSVGGVTFDRKWRHMGIVATTGARKSTLLAMLGEQLDVPFIVISGDAAPPLENLIRSRGGYVWKPRGELPWYPWGGPLEQAVQRAEHMHPATGGDVGVHRAGFKHASRVAWGMADKAEVDRTLDQVLAVLPTVVRGQSTAMMVENWTLRVREITESLGPSLGSGLDIVEALRAGRDVGIFLNSFQDPSNRKRFASIAVLEALRAADTLGNIGVLIDEVGLVGAELFGDAVRVFRVRLCTGIFSSQIADDFPGEVRGNVNVWFLGQQSGGDKRSRQWSSDTTFGLVPPEHFGEHVLPQGTFWVVAGGRVQQANIPTWKPRRERPAPPLPGFAGAYTVTEVFPSEVEEPAGYSVNEPVAIERMRRNGVHALPPPNGGESDELRARCQAYLYREGECERWKGKHDRKGYGQVWLNGAYDYIHIVRWEAAYGPIPRDPVTGKRMQTLDHQSTCPKDCSRVTHLEMVTRAENTARSWRTGRRNKTVRT